MDRCSTETSATTWDEVPLVAAVAAAWGCRARWATAKEDLQTQWLVYALVIGPLELVVRAALAWAPPPTETTTAFEGARARPPWPRAALRRRRCGRAG